MRYRSNLRIWRDYETPNLKSCFRGTRPRQRRLQMVSPLSLISRKPRESRLINVAQNDIIANLTTLNDKHAIRISSLEKSLASASLRSSSQAPPVEVAPAPAPAPAPSTLSKSEQKELKALREEVGKLRSGVKEKDTKSERTSLLKQAWTAKLIVSRPARTRVPSRGGQLSIATTINTGCTKYFNYRAARYGRC